MKKNKHFTIVLLIIILTSFCSCGESRELTSYDDLQNMYAENKELFQEAAKDIEKMSLQVLFSFNREGNCIEVDSKEITNSQISQDLKTKLLACFAVMDNIVISDYDRSAYNLSIGVYNFSDAYEPVISFDLSTEEACYSVAYSQSKLEDKDYTKIDDNWGMFIASRV